MISLRTEQKQSCLRCLQMFEALTASTGLKPRRRSALMLHLHVFLQYLVAHTEYTVETVSKEAVLAWLEPSSGLSIYDDRVAMLRLLSKCTSNASLRVADQRGSRRLRALSEQWAWRRHQRELVHRTQNFFSSIQQEDILDEEERCGVFYEALHEIYTEASSAGVFDESDEVVAQLLRRLVPYPPQTVMDVGCGYGRLLKRLGVEFAGARLIGTSILDIREDERRSLEAASIKVIRCTANRIAAPDNSQDIVVSTEVIEHLRQPEDLVREIHRVLKVGGTFCVTAPSKGSYLFGRNPLTYLAIGLSSIVPDILPPFHNLYAPLTPLRLVHYGFDPREFRELFASSFPQVTVETSRFIALKKFRLDGVANRIPLLRNMGGLCVAFGRRS